jgi:Tol biopolymer transport system component
MLGRHRHPTTQRGRAPRLRRNWLTVAAAALVATVLGPTLPAAAVFKGPAKLIAFDFNGSIYTAAPDGSPQHRLAVGSYPRWSPNGKQIAFERKSNIWVMNANGSNAHKVTHNGASHRPAWSRDGKTLVFVVVQHPHGDLFTMPATGGPMTRLTNDAASTCGDDHPTWFPNRDAIAYIRSVPDYDDCEYVTHEIWILDLVTGTKTLVVADGPEPYYTPAYGPPDVTSDGKHLIAFRGTDSPVTDTGSIVQMDLSGGHQHVLATGRLVEGRTYIQWGVVAANPAGGPPAYAYAVDDAAPYACGLQAGASAFPMATSGPPCPDSPDWQP